jgi:MYXO-CTERM domain-containing protein
MKKIAGLLLGVLVLSGCAANEPEELERARSSLSSQTVQIYVVLDGPAAVELLPPGADPGAKESVAIVRGRLRAQAEQRTKIVPELEALGGVVVADLVLLANALQVIVPDGSLRAIESLPGVVSLEAVPFYEPSLSSAVPVIGAPKLWQNTTPFDGEGITIGIIDSGIDYTHADFGGAGTKAAFDANDPKLIEPGSFPTAKVVGGHDFVGNAYYPGGGVDFPSPDPDPLDCLKPQSIEVAGGHGTHVAGIAAGAGVTLDGSTYAGPYDQSFNPTQFRIGPGVAPRAKLYALKIFGCQGGTTMLAPALERAADPNKDGDLSDRLDVVNASLGTSYAVGSATQDKLIDNLVAVGSVFVAAAGNEGDAFFSISSPASHRAALSVAASADSQLISLDITAPASAAGSVAAAEGGFTTRLIDSGPKSGSVVFAQPPLACSNLTNAADVQGKIVMFDRGSCSFVKKFSAAVAAGAIAAIVVDDEDQPVPFAMGGGDPGQVPIPGVMIKKSDGALLKSALGQGLQVTMDGSKLFQGPGSELLASFSSRGPTAHEERLKPEISAPGFAIDSARVGSGSLARRSQGTSMASPMVAGAAALVRQARPSFSALDVKAAIVNGASTLIDLAQNPYPASAAGAGRISVDHSAALDVTAFAVDDGTIGTSFGMIEVAAPTSVERELTIENKGTTSLEYTVSAVPAAQLAGVVASVEPSSFDLAPATSVTVKLKLEVDPAALPAPAPDPTTALRQYDQARHFLTEVSGHVRFSSAAAPAQTVAVPYFAAVRHGLSRQAKPLPACGSGAPLDEPITLELEGETGKVTPAVSIFQLGATHDRHPLSDTDAKRAMLDLLAVGAATDLAAKEDDFEAASVFFGVAVAGEWRTPALGVASIANVYIDADMNGSADFVVRAEPFSREGPYMDVLTATTYDLSTNQPTQSKRFLNMLPADKLNTQPFHNSVIVLSAFLRDLGIDAENPLFNYRAFTQSYVPFESGELTDWVTFDVTKPLVDTAFDGLESRPVFSGDQALVRLDPDAFAGDPPRLLLLHHTNLKGKRHEIVDLIAPAGNVALAATGPASAKVGQRIAFELTATNQSSLDVSVTLSASLTGATVASLDPRCSAAGSTSFGCELGAVPPGSAVSVALEATATAAGTANGARLEATAQVDLPCESSTVDNTASVSVALESGAPAAKKELEPAGGCACRARGAGDAPAPLPALAAALAFAALARRRRRAAGRA